MPHVIDPTLRPLHAKIYEAIREHWLTSGQGPSKLELMRACGVSMTTVIQATNELRRRGFVLAPKFSVRGIKPTDMERTVSTKPLDPWAELDDAPQRY